MTRTTARGMSTPTVLSTAETSQRWQRTLDYAREN